MHKEYATGKQERAGVTRVSDKGIRPFGDESVLFLDREFESKETAEGAVAELAKDACCNDEEASYNI